jgi:uncharacterized membrane protein YqgA involved in biofilm formation
MTGTIINVITVITGSLLGALLGDRLPERIRTIVIQGVGLVVLALGVDMALATNNFLLVLGSVVVGGILGAWWRLEDRLDRAGAWLKARADRFPFLTQGAFIQGYVSASLVFCIGPMAILGSFQDGLTGDFTLLAIKSVMDGFTSLAFAATMGMGVAFSAITVFLYQGALTLGAASLETVLTEPMITELTATGGILMLGLGLLMLEIKTIKVANFLPALLIAPLLVAILDAFGV